MKTNSLFRTAALAALTVAAGAGVATKGEAQAPRTTNEAVQFKINGRLQMDVANIDANYSTPAAGTDAQYGRSFVRRVFLGAEGRMTDNWRYNVKLDLAPDRGDAVNPGSEVTLDDAFLEYAGGFGSIFIGNANAVSNMEDRTSSNEIPFVERSGIVQAFNPGRVLSLSLLTGGGNWSAGIALQGDSVANNETTATTSPNRGEPFGVMGRVTWAPLYQKTPEGLTLVHLGLMARDRDANGDGAFGYSARPNVASFSGLGAPVSGAGGSHDDLYGAELAFQRNAFGAEAEYMQLKTDRGGSLPDAEYNGYYVDVFFSPTGESRNYVASDGSFTRITPLRPLGSDGGIGHVMLSARYEFLDLNDGTGASAVFGGEQKGYVLGATWKPIGYVKFLLNYSDYSVDRKNAANVAQAGDGDFKSVTLRTQLDW
jgi:phosphate-selective porin OprO/OprP